MKQPIPRIVVSLSLVTLIAAALVTGCGGSSSDDGATAGSKQMSQAEPGRVPPPGKNRLYFEKSPYLLQHAGNPVDWYPWGEEAFAKARAEDKPVFLSVGYSTCHWCHVMEHESFEDPEVAALMNETFVCIKVDREERPDVDHIYMTVCQMMTGKGGWPLTVLLTPDRVPFFAATYIPKPAMLNMIPKVAETWTGDRDRVVQYTDQLLETLKGISTGSPGAALTEGDLKTAYEQLSGRFDPAWGGFGSAPKFPTPHNMMFLLRRWKRTNDEAALAMVETTLERMRRGGVYDHVGFGFHRYSTDQRWFLPHFEKMLYDQAMLVMAYTEAYQATGNQAYRRTAEEIVTYVLRDMTDAQGGFYSAEDADSEGEEGKFYVWTADELHGLVGDDAQFVIDVFGVEEDGNWQEEASGHRAGTNILFLEKPLSEVAIERGESEDELRRRWEPIRQRLFDEREKRLHPYKDDKVLTDWNGLMIAALAKAARAFEKPEFARSAGRAAEFVMTRMENPDGGLYHRYRDGEASITSMVDDYAFFVWGLLELYQTTFDVGYLNKALYYNDYLIEHFWDDEAGGLFFTSDEGEALIVRSKEVYDGAIPSGNSVAMLDFIRLARITARTAYEERARDLGSAFHEQVARGASAFTMMMSAVDFALGPSFEIVVAGHAGRDDSRRMLSELGRRYIPSKVVVFRPEEEADPVVALAPYTKSQSAVGGEATAYVCRNYACELPTTDIDKMLELLGEQ
jgi:uncharacterized protein YyaL (SSP411 family)